MTTAVNICLRTCSSWRWSSWLSRAALSRCDGRKCALGFSLQVNWISAAPESGSAFPPSPSFIHPSAPWIVLCSARGGGGGWSLPFIWLPCLRRSSTPASPSAPTLTQVRVKLRRAIRGAARALHILFPFNLQTDAICLFLLMLLLLFLLSQ